MSWRCYRSLRPGEIAYKNIYRTGQGESRRNAGCRAHERLNSKL
jgi:hypothetical protein